MKSEQENPKNSDKLRRKAEEKLRLKRQTNPLPDLTEVDTRRLLHELEVHQIELEMQNEELQHIQEELEASRLLYFDLFDLAPAGYLILDDKNTIQEANFTVSSLLGLDRGELNKQPITRFILPEDQDIFYRHCQILFDKKIPQNCEIRIRPINSDPMWVRIDSTVSQMFNGVTVCRVMLSDISDRRKAEEALTYLSTHDKLTGLYNRAFFEDELARFERGREFPVSIVIADVDHLKIINDSDGHAAGDALLIRAAHAMTTAFRTEDVIARIGGDEFAVLLPNTSAVSSEIMLNRVREVIEQDNSKHKKTLLSLSLGASTAEKNASLKEVLKLADENMYQDKRKNNKANDDNPGNKSNKKEIHQQGEE